MNHINLDTLPEPVRQFIRGLAAGPDGSVIEENGRPVAHVLPARRRATGAGANRAWTDEKNQRRCALIRKKFSQGIGTDEARELADLQDEVSAYRKQVGPVPYDVVDALEEAVNGSSAPTP